ncbi:murein hydrolase activator EnvC family protein, partial [Accumulibacter sp.]|uniref:murein hydrolase activator EnvC family protein n=1 Tax=Accumulibacter sp. TaxID=2053492 RepID=UPI00391AF047
MPAALLVAATLLAPSFAANGRQNTKDADAASPGDVAEKQSDLKSLRAQIDAMRREMTAAESSQKQSTDQLKDAERAISMTQRELHELATQVTALQTSRQGLEVQSREIEQRLQAQQAQLEKLLYRQYLRGNPDPLRLLLNGDDPYQLARDLHYLEAIGRARSALLREIETSLNRQQSLATDMQQQAARLSAAETKRKEEHAKLLAQREQRQATLDKISAQIAAQRREIGNLQRDEKQLAGLVDRLSKIIAARAAEARAARREAQLREQAQR